MMKIVLSVTAGLIMAVGISGMDTFILKNGKQVQGEITDTTGQFVTIYSGGNHLKILKSLIISGWQTGEKEMSETAHNAKDTTIQQIPVKDTAGAYISSQPKPDDSSSESNLSDSISTPESTEKEKTGTPVSLPGLSTLLLTSEPAGAVVEINGKVHGKTPLRVIDIPAGTHRLTFSYAGFVKSRDSVKLSASEIRRIAVKLTSGQEESLSKKGITPDSTEKASLEQAVVREGEQQNGKSGLAKTALDEGVIFITVLPLQGEGSVSELLPVFTDILRKELAETGKFKVMAREMMEQIVEERKLQLSGICSDSTSMAAAGEIFGVSRIVAGSVANPQKNTWVVSVKMIDVATGSTIGPESEKLSGDVFASVKQMLKNLASVLAGSQSKGHQENTRMIEKETADLSLQQKIESNRFRIGVSGEALYPLHLFQKSSYESVRQAFESDTACEILDKASDKFSSGITLQGDYRVNKFLSAGFTLGWNSADPGTDFAKRSYNYLLDTILGLDTVVMNGPVASFTRTQIDYSVFTAGISLGMRIVNSPRVAVNVSINPQWGYVFYNLIEHDSSLWDLPTYINSEYKGQTQQYDEIVRDAQLKGNAFGGGLGAAVSFFPFSRLELSASIGLRTLIAPNLEGKEQIDSVSILRDYNGNTETARGSRSQNAAIMKGDFLGTGEYLSVQDPSRKSIDGVPTQKAWMEFSSLKISLAVTFLF